LRREPFSPDFLPKGLSVPHSFETFDFGNFGDDLFRR